MGILRIKKILKNIVEEEAAQPKFSESRLSERHRPILDDYFKVSFDGNEDIKVVDFSFGGFAVDRKALKKEVEKDSEFEAEFKVLDQAIKTKIKIMHINDDLIGFKFLHSNSENLLFLRLPVESLSNGASLLQLNRALLSEKYQDSDWYCFRGDGPTDLVYRIDENKKLEEALLTFLSRDLLKGASYVAVEYKDGHLKTLQAIDQFGFSARMAQTTKFDMQSIRQALQILSGLALPETVNQLAPFIDACRKSLPDGES